MGRPVQGRRTRKPATWRLGWPRLRSSSVASRAGHTLGRWLAVDLLLRPAPGAEVVAGVRPTHLPVDMVLPFMAAHEAKDVLHRYHPPSSWNPSVFGGERRAVNAHVVSDGACSPVALHECLGAAGSPAHRRARTGSAATLTASITTSALGCAGGLAPCVGNRSPAPSRPNHACTLPRG